MTNNNDYHYEEDAFEYPVIDKNSRGLLVVHSHINEKGKMILNKTEALLMIAELYKFVKS